MPRTLSAWLLGAAVLATAAPASACWELAASASWRVVTPYPTAAPASPLPAPWSDWPTLTPLSDSALGVEVPGPGVAIGGFEFTQPPLDGALRAEVE